MMKVLDRLDKTVWLIKCPHQATISLEASEWCKLCNDWIDGVDVAELFVIWQERTQNRLRL